MQCAETYERGSQKDTKSDSANATDGNTGKEERRGHDEHPGDWDVE